MIAVAGGILLAVFILIFLPLILRALGITLIIAIILAIILAVGYNSNWSMQFGLPMPTANFLALLAIITEIAVWFWLGTIYTDWANSLSKAYLRFLANFVGLIIGYAILFGTVLAIIFFKYSY